MIELFNPIAQPRPRDIDPVPGLDTLQWKVISLLSNTHPGVDPFMDRLQELLEQGGEVASVLRWRKSSISRPMSPELKAEICAKSHAVITGVGT
jgi:hypothetical protein